MTNNSLRALAAALAFCLAIAATPAADAATYIVPTDRDLVHRSDDVVVATGVASTVERDTRGSIVTRYTLRIDEVLKGWRSAGDTLVLTERGGVLGEQATIIPGTPEYVPGIQYLIFTSTNREMDPTTWGMAVGHFRILPDNHGTLALRNEIHGFDERSMDEHAELARDANGFKSFIRDVVEGRASSQDYFVENAQERQLAVEWKVAPTYTKNSYLMQSGGIGFRWQTPSATFVYNGTHTPGSDGPESIGVAFAQWNGVAAGIDYSDGGADAGATAGLTARDGRNGVLFGDPNDEIDGAAGIGGIKNAWGPYQIGDESFYIATEVDVVIENMTFSQSCLNGVMTHEIGHTLGLRHSDQPYSPSDDVTSNAIMNSSVNCSFNGVLRTYDQNAVQTVYGSGSTCNPPSITTQPASKTVPAGQPTTLTVAATGTSLAYAWFKGASGDTSSPVGTNSATLSVNTTIEGMTSYWVRVSGACGSPVNSAAATVTVTCASPQITNQPTGRSISEGSTTQLQVSATGSNLTYQWYIGATGDMSSPVWGGTSDRIAVTPLTTTDYWVRITGSCGAPLNSATARVTVVPCGDVTINSAGASPVAAGRSTLSVTASSSNGPLTYQWYRGNTPGSGGVLVSASQSVSVSVTTATSYWVRVANACGKSALSGVITVASCTLPSIATQPQDQRIGQGASATLSIASNGTLVKWFRGAVGDTSAQVGSGPSFNTGALTSTTFYWAQVSNDCGTVSSRQVTVTVEQTTDTVRLLNGRFTVQVRYRNQFENPPLEGKLLGRSLFSSSLSETAIFTFGDPLVVELMVRFSDARPWDDHVHFYFGGLSDVEFFISVTDSLTGATKEYHKPAGKLVGEVDRTTFPATTSPLQSGIAAMMQQTAADAISPLADSSTIRLLNGRYEVRMRYRNQFANPPTTGYLLGRSIASSPITETAIFYFDNGESAEWMVRFSDTRPFANRIDMYHGGLSDVEYTIEVLDTATGIRREYAKGPGSLEGQVDRVSFQP